MISQLQELYDPILLVPGRCRRGGTIDGRSGMICPGICTGIGMDLESNIVTRNRDANRHENSTRRVLIREEMSTWE